MYKLETDLLSRRPDMRIHRLLLLICLFAAAPALTQAAPATKRLAKLDKPLRESVERGCTDTKSVIVRTEPGSREALRKTLESHGAAINGEFPALDAIVVNLNCEDLVVLDGFSSVRSISGNHRVHGQQFATIQQTSTLLATASVSSLNSKLLSRLAEAMAASSLQTNLLSTLASRTDVSGMNTRPPVGVAVIDSGIQPGIDFGNRISAFYDFTQGDIRAAKPSDEYGHGTHVAGLVGGLYTGVAPTSRLIGLKVLDGQGRGTTENVIRAIEFAIAAKGVLNIQILNLSLGHPIYESAATDPMVQAVEHAVRSGLTVFISAGNFGINRNTGQTGYAGLISPANAPSSIAVGSVRTFDTVTRSDDRIAAYSSRGPSWYDGFAKPDISAPGDNLLSVAAEGSTLRLAQESRGNSGSYMRLSGTSMAAGVASGAAALVLQANQGLTPNALKAVLEYTSIPVRNDAGGYYDPLTQGVGQIQVAGALQLAQAIDLAAPLGSGWLMSSFSPSTVIGDIAYQWSQSIIWGNRRVIGATLLSEQRPAWALEIVWGEGLGDEDDNIVWGNLFDDDDNIVWGNFFDEDDNIVWGNNIVWGSDDDDNIVWGNLFDDFDNIVWGNFFDDDDNIVWGNFFDDDDNIVWGNNVVWGSGLIGFRFDDDDNIVWGNFFDDFDNIVWGNLFDDFDNIVWGNLFDDFDNIVWGNGALLGDVVTL
jgi:serine protease AprX